jgi:citronellyl-CoA synthetase
MSQTTQPISLRLLMLQHASSFFPKCRIFSGLKQAYLRTPTTPAGLGIAFEKAVKRNPQGMLYYLKIKVTAIKI